MTEDDIPERVKQVFADRKIGNGPSPAEALAIAYRENDRLRGASALHSSAPHGMKCADCAMGNGAPCPDCYATWWRRENPHWHVIGSEFEPCCERDHNGDGNCDIHSAPGVFRNIQLNEARLNQAVSAEFIDIVFDGPPGPIPGRFVEVENEKGASIRVGEWIVRCDSLHALRIPTGLRQIPTAWMRGRRSDVPGEPTEFDVELEYGDDRPEGDGWKPLYSRVRL